MIPGYNKYQNITNIRIKKILGVSKYQYVKTSRYNSYLDSQFKIFVFSQSHPGSQVGSYVNISIDDVTVPEKLFHCTGIDVIK